MDHLWSCLPVASHPKAAFQSTLLEIIMEVEHGPFDDLFPLPGLALP